MGVGAGWAWLSQFRMEGSRQPSESCRYRHSRFIALRFIAPHRFVFFNKLKARPFTRKRIMICFSLILALWYDRSSGIEPAISPPRFGCI